MEESGRGEVEERIQALCRAGEHRGAATGGLQAYGGEVYSYLVAVTRSGADADEAYSRFCLAYWEALPDFRWECSLRTWVYTLARSALTATGRERAARAVPMSHAPEVLDVAAQVRTATLEYLRTDVKDRFARMREQLDPEEQTLLILRVDRNLAWRDIARVLSDEPDADLDKRAAPLRKRFERVKETLRKLLDE